MKKSWIAIVVGLSLGAIVGVASATLGKQEAVAFPCCSQCDAIYGSCMDNCNGYAPCQARCEIDDLKCWGFCSSSC